MKRFYTLAFSFVFSAILTVTTFAQFSSAGGGNVIGNNFVPIDGATTLRWDDGVNFNSVGLTAGGTFEAAARFPASVVGPLTGQYIKQVMTFIGDPGTLTLKIYGAGTATTPGAVLYTQSFTALTDEWKTIDLTTPVLLDGGDVWVSIEVVHTASLFPAGTDDGPAVVDGDWIFNGGTWSRLSVIAPTLNYNWNIAAVVDEIIPVELTSFSASVNDGQVNLNWQTATETNNYGFEVQRSSEDYEFVTIGFIEGNGTTTEAQNYSYSDKSVTPGVFTYRLKQVDYDGKFEYSNEIEVDFTSVPTAYSLNQNFPNPFNPSTKISFALPVESDVTVKIFNVIGEEINSIAKGTLGAGSHSFDFNASGLNSGVYFYSLEAHGTDGSSFSEVKKMMFTK